MFAELLNVSDAMNKAVHWWNYVVGKDWNSPGGYFQYHPDSATYECDASFFLEIISELKHYYPALRNWDYVLTDIGNRFLSNEWNSKQWSDYVIVHASGALSNAQLRLENTLGTWQMLMGVYLQLNSANQNNIADMLSGNDNTQPAWSLLCSSAPGLHKISSGLFHMHSDSSDDDYNATAYAEILLFMMGIVPRTTTVAFPLEELCYQYTWDIDPVSFSLNSTARQISIPVVSQGTITFQYGIAPITYTFSQRGAYQVYFSPSWNLITNVTRIGSLSSNVPS